MDDTTNETLMLALVDMLNESLGLLDEALTAPDLAVIRERIETAVRALDTELDSLLIENGYASTLQGRHSHSPIEKA